MKEIGTVYLSIIVFFSQIIFLWLRTLNIKSTAEGKDLENSLDWKWNRNRGQGSYEF